MGSTGPHGQHRAYSPSGRRPRSLLLTDPHLGVVRLWLLLHIRTVIFKGVVFIWKPQQLQRYNWTREATAVRIARTSGRRPKTPDPNSSVHSEYPPELNSPPTTTFTNLIEDTSKLHGLSISLGTSERLLFKCQSTEIHKPHLYEV